MPEPLAPELLPPPPPPPPPPELLVLLGDTVTLKLLYSTASPYFTVAVRVTLAAAAEGRVTIPDSDITFELLLFHVITEPFILPFVSRITLLVIV